MPGVEVSHVLLHGERIAYRRAGTTGPVLLLIHGMASSSATWEPVLAALGERCQVIAPDLLGHGASDKPRVADYSLGAYASGLRDLLTALGHDRATVVGHSLGGGVALQFAYQFPERCERLVLVSSGGLGKEVHTILRAAALPGFGHVLRVFSGGWVTGAGGTAKQLLNRVGLRGTSDAEQSLTSLRALSDPATRAAFIKTVRSVITAGGQSVSAIDRLYLAAGVPTMLVWGDRDRIIPVDHARATHERILGSRLEIVEGSGHYPHHDNPDGFVDGVLEFMADTPCAEMSTAQWRELLLADGERRAAADTASP